MNHQVPLVAQLPGPEREAASAVRMQAPDADMPIGSGLEDARETAGSDTQHVADESQPSEQVLLVEVDPCRPRLSRCTGCSCRGSFERPRGQDRWQRVGVVSGIEARASCPRARADVLADVPASASGARALGGPTRSAEGTGPFARRVTGAGRLGLHART